MPTIYNRAGVMVAPSIKGFYLGSRTIITTPGANNYTPPTYSKFLLFQVQGSGGAGRNCANSSAGQIVLGGGGGAGQYCELPLYPFPATIVVTIGTGGAGASGASGSNTTIAGPSFSSQAPTPYIWCIAGGGAGGGSLTTGTTQAFPLVSAGGTGGQSLTGIELDGRNGGIGYRDSGTVARSGAGKPSLFGAGGRAIIAHGAGNAGGFGAGGSGGMSVNAAGATNGGSGGNGICVVWEYY